ncbi:hypothetical protein NKR19_g6119 [Coniochaeta hoffmannii]|uniref:PX domain-containing protein n=1 Tax=Coniochaeta hoffmannii TaxID=91930 RepID=A0AA38S218_9PEZI|nr:hypothetical protein NKR19_g6119 [Coniochaeta hoffmannii]
MHVRPLDIAPISTNLLFHSRKRHDSYNGTRHLPISTWVRSPTIRTTDYGEHVLVYEIVLFYSHNRACTIFRTWDDFRTLKRGLPSWKRATDFYSPDDIQTLDGFLREALAKRPRECAMEYFLRRRMEDCAGHC